MRVSGGDAGRGTVGRSFVGVGGRTDSMGVVSVQGPETEVRPREVHQLQHPSDGASQEVTMRRVDPTKDRMGMIQGKTGRRLEVEAVPHAQETDAPSIQVYGFPHEAGSRDAGAVSNAGASPFKPLGGMALQSASGSAREFSLVEPGEGARAWPAFRGSSWSAAPAPVQALG
ncbi:unnamed protein product, partial [Scytosiphon promiscuus]